MTPAAPSRRTDRANRVGHLEAIHQLTAAMVTSTTVESIHGAALDVLVASLSADRAAILLFDRDGIIRFKAWRGLSDGYRQAASGHSPWRPDEADPEAIVVADAATDESLGALRGTVLAEGIRSLAFIPLLYGTRLLGKFMLYSAEPGQFGPDELALARTVAAHVAFALEKRRLEDELRLSADKLAATLNAVSEGITVQAPDGRLILANEAAAAMVGFPSVPALLAASPAEIMTAFETFDANGQVLSVERLPGRAALRGQEPEEMLVRSRLAATGVERISVVKARAVRDEAGEVRFAVNIFRDVTDRELAVEALRTSEARLAFLASASRRLLTTDLEPRKVLEEVADLVVPELADWCIVREFDDDGRLVRVAVRPPRDEQNEIETQLERYGDLLPEHPAVQDLIKGRSILVNDITMAILEQLARDDEHLELLTQLGLRSVMLVPLRTRGRTTGVLTLAGGRDRPAYTDSDLALAEEFAGRVSATVDNARSFAVEHSTAETLARALLPGRLPDIPGLQLAARYRAAGEVGGDFYDCFPVGDGTWMLAVGDVCGRGIHAASMTGLTRHTIRAAALHSKSPAAVLRDLNRLLFTTAEEHLAAWLSKDQCSEPGFCTVCLATVTPSAAGARVVVSSAGHPLPLLLRGNAEVLEVGRPGSLLGVVADLELSEESWQLGPGDALVLFTDGVTERRRDGRLFGEARLRPTLRALAGAPAAELAGKLESAAVAFACQPPIDDMAVLAVCVPNVPITLEIPPAAAVTAPN